MKRICPQCKKTLKAHEGYFCLSCGYKLEDNLILPKPVFQVRRNKFSPDKSASKISPKFVIPHKVKLALAIVSGFIVVFYALFFLIKIVTRERKLLLQKDTRFTEKIVYNNASDFNLSFPHIIFGNKDLTKYVPSEVDFYIEGENFNQAFNYFLSNSDENILLEKLSKYLKGNYALFGIKEKSAWRFALITILNNSEIQDLIEQSASPLTPEEDLDIAVEGDSTQDVVELAEIEQVGDEFTYELVGNALVITNYKEFINDISQASKGITKNITHNTKYSSFTSYLPKDGQLIVMNFTEDSNLLFDLVLAFNPTEDAVKMLEQVKALEYNKFVIRKND